jgi:hypothetical protein
VCAGTPQPLNSGECVRVSVQWAGPIKRHEIDQWLKTEAVAEFAQLLVSV